MSDPKPVSALVRAEQQALRWFKGGEPYPLFLRDVLEPFFREHADAAAKAMEARKDAAYYERNQVVAALAKCFPACRTRTSIEGWSDDWHGCVYIDLPTGQVSWHYHDSHVHLFEYLPERGVEWDGHDTEEKYRRLAALESRAAAKAARDERDRYWIEGLTRLLDEHPEDWDGPCECATCLSYGD